MLSSIEELFEALSYQGIVFPENFLMFAKTLITLKGVIADIDSDFNRDDYMLWGALVGLFRDLFRLHFYGTVIKEVYLFHRYSIRKLIEFHKLIIKLGFKLGSAGIPISLFRCCRAILNNTSMSQRFP